MSSRNMYLYNVYIYTFILFENRYCGDSLPADIVSSGNTMTIYFHSDWAEEYNGFQANFTEEIFEYGKGFTTGPKWLHHRIFFFSEIVLKKMLQ